MGSVGTHFLKQDKRANHHNRTAKYIDIEKIEISNIGIILYHSLSLPLSSPGALIGIGWGEIHT